MKKVEKPKKPLIFYYLIALIILVLLNTFLFPNILGKNKVKEVDYGTFLTMVEGKEVSKVELNGDTIYFTDNSEEPKYYETTTFDDPNLVNRLEDAGCEFGRVAQQEMNPLLSFFLVWILPSRTTVAFGAFSMVRLSSTFLARTSCIIPINVFAIITGRKVRSRKDPTRHNKIARTRKIKLK